MANEVFLFSNGSTNRGGMTKLVDPLKLKAAVLLVQSFNLTIEFMATTRIGQSCYGSESPIW